MKVKRTKVKIPVFWEMRGEVEVEVETLGKTSIFQICRKAIDYFYDNYDKIERPEGEYVEGSFMLTPDESDIDDLRFYNK